MKRLRLAALIGAFIGTVILAQPSGNLNLNLQPIKVLQGGTVVQTNVRQYAIDCRGTATCTVDAGFLYITTAGGGGGFTPPTCANGQVLVSFDGVNVICVKAGGAYAADASITAIIAQVAYSSDASVTAVVSQFAFAADASATAQYATSSLVSQLSYSADASTYAQQAVTSQFAYSADAAVFAAQATNLAVTCGGGQYVTCTGTACTCSTPAGSGGKVSEAYMADAATQAQYAYLADAAAYATQAGTAYGADASVYAQQAVTSQVSYSADAAVTAVVAQFAYAADASSTAQQATTAITSQFSFAADASTFAVVAQTAYAADAATQAQYAFSADAAGFSGWSYVSANSYAADASYWSQDAGKADTAVRLALTCSAGQFVTCNGVTCSCSTPSGGGGAGGSANVVGVDVTMSGPFGKATVTGQTWVGSTSSIICSPQWSGSASAANTAEVHQLASMTPTVTNLVVGTGFDLLVFDSRFFGVSGTFHFSCTGV